MQNQTLTQSQAGSTESNFISRVFLWMSAGLAVSGAGALFLLSQPDLLRAMVTNRAAFWILLIAEVGLVLWLSAAIMRLSTAMATSLFLAYSFLNGLTMSWILVLYTGASVVSTFAITAGTFFFFAMYGITTKKDLTSIGRMCGMALWGFLIASIVNFFLKSPAVYWISTYAGIAIFLGLIAYDTQKLKAFYASSANTEAEGKLAILGALMLYLDFVNLFLLLLRIFGNRRN